MLCLTWKEVLCTKTVWISQFLGVQGGRRHQRCCICCPGPAVSAALDVHVEALLPHLWTCTYSMSTDTSVTGETERCFLQHEKVLKHETLWGEQMSCYHFWRSSRLVSAGLPMQAICCRCFHPGSSTAVRVSIICFARFKMFTICCSTNCNTKKNTKKPQKALKGKQFYI